MQQDKIKLAIEQTINLAKKQGATSLDVLAIDNNTKGVNVRNGEVESIESSESIGLGLRVFIDNKSALASTSNLSNDSLNSLVERTINMAKLAPSDEYSFINNDKNLFAQNIDNLDLFDDSNIEIDRLTEIANTCENAALCNKQITNSEGSEAGVSKSNLFLAIEGKDNNFFGSYKTSSFSTSVCVLAEKNGSMERDYDFSSVRHFKNLKDPAEIGKEAALRTIARLGAKQPKTGNFPVIFEKREAKSLLSHFLSAINGASIVKGTSFLSQKMDEKIFNNEINIVNNPLLKQGLNSKPFDAEGLATKKFNLTENGVLKNWLLDLRAAKKLNLTPNACASRGLSSNPNPSFSNVYIENGKASTEELIANIKEGIFITDLFGNGVNLLTGDFSQGATGYWIENGKKAYPINEFTIAGNLNDMFKSLVAANDLSFEYSINTPTLMVEKMMIAGSN